VIRGGQWCQVDEQHPLNTRQGINVSAVNQSLRDAGQSQNVNLTASTSGAYRDGSGQAHSTVDRGNDYFPPTPPVSLSPGSNIPPVSNVPSIARKLENTIYGLADRLNANPVQKPLHNPIPIKEEPTDDTSSSVAMAVDIPFSDDNVINPVHEQIHKTPEKFWENTRHEKDGLHYMSLKSSGELNKDCKSIEEMWAHMTVGKSRIRAEQFKVSDYPIPQSILDFINDMRLACAAEDSEFWWPSSSLGFQNVLACAMHYAMGGEMICIQNVKPLPERYLNLPEGRLRDYFHSTPAIVAPKICKRGILPSFGAGQDALRDAYNIQIPCCYFADWNTAMTYPMSEETATTKQPEGILSGAGLIASDGTAPFRLTIRVLADINDRIWHARGQSTFLAGEFYITHYCFYATSPRFIFEKTLGTIMSYAWLKPTEEFR